MLAERSFTMQDQEFFASASGDSNPMHMDAVAARRTVAGVPVVHGVHNLLWCIDTIAQHLDRVLMVSEVRANFDSFVAVGDPVKVVLLKHDATGVRAIVQTGNVTVLTVALSFGQHHDLPVATNGGDRYDGFEPLNLTIDEIYGKSGRVILIADDTLQQTFPHATLILGSDRIAGLAGMTRLVGMACPGLHSIFNALSIKAVSGVDRSAREIAYQVAKVDPRYHRLVQNVSGGGWVGTVTCTVRPPPMPQPSTELLASRVEVNAFRNLTGLVVGGSRGLGELTAKLIAAGGGTALITYDKGQADAERVVDSIRAFGGKASLIRYNVLDDPGPQLSNLIAVPTHLFYFATPPIAGRRTKVFELDRFEYFLRFYVTGFFNIALSLQALTSETLKVLYPSTVFIEDRPKGMTEYAMAKAAGEQLCRDLVAETSRLEIITPRLPMLPTDQTAAIQNLATQDPVAILLSYIKMIYEN